MKYAENQKISQKQLFSQASVSMLGLCLMAAPEFLRFSFKSIILCLILTAIFFWMQSIYFIRICPCYERPLQYFGKWVGKGFGLIYVFYLLISQVLLLRLIADLANYYFVERTNKIWLIILTGVVCAFGMYRQIEKRARIGEIILPVILFFIVIMLILAFRDFSFGEILKESKKEMTTMELLAGFYQCICLFLPVYFLPFLLMQTKKNSSAKKSINGSICMNLGIMFVALLLLLGLLGREGYLHKKYPMIDLMSGVNLPGDFFQRSDLFWSGSLLFCLFYLCGSIFFYQHEVLKRCEIQNWNLVIMIIEIVLAVFAKQLKLSFEKYRMLILYGYGILLPVLTLLAGIQYKKKRTEKGR